MFLWMAPTTCCPGAEGIRGVFDLRARYAAMVDDPMSALLLLRNPDNELSGASGIPFGFINSVRESPRGRTIEWCCNA